MDLSWIDVTDMRVVGGILAVLAAVYLILDAYVSRTRDGWIGFWLEFRWILIVFIVLPLSRGLSAYWRLRDFVYDTFLAKPHLHSSRVAEIQRRVKAFRAAGGPKAAGGRLLCTSRPQWLRTTLRQMDYQTSKNAIPIPLFDILELDTEALTVRVEPSVTMGRLSRFLIARGYCLQVVPELDELTVGGLINGYGVETSSHKYGLVADTATAYEVVLSSGEVVTATPDNEYADLFHAVPWSYGALGFLVCATLRVRKAEKYVKLSYYPTRTTEETTTLFDGLTVSDSPPNFVEGLMYNKNEGVVMSGDFAPESEALAHPDQINDITIWHKTYFGEHVQNILNDFKKAGSLTAASSFAVGVTKPAVVEYIPTVAYFHRHVKGIFWEMKLILPFGHHAWFRYLFGWSLPASIPLIKATQPPSLTKFYQDRHIAQDGLVPLEKLPQGIEFFHKNFECYPLWLCPHKLCFTSPQGMLRPSKEAVARGLVKPGKWEQYVDIGCYYSPGPILRGEEYDCVQARKNYEQFLIENSGYQALYAITEMTRDQWATMFDTELYDKCRTKYDAVGWFMDAYDKVCRPKGEAAKKRS